MLQKLAGFWRGFLGAIVGAIVVIAVLHLYWDHRALHEMVNVINAAAAAKQAVPAPAVTP